MFDQQSGADFAFIDGDHRVEAIRRDYAALAKSDVIVFDDFYDASSSLPKVSPVRFFEDNEQALADMKRMSELEAGQ